MAKENLGVDIGDALQLQFLGEESDARYYVRVIGYLADKSLLVTAPQANGRLLTVREGQPLAVRMMAGNKLVGFTVSVLRICARPYSYLHLSYPTNTQSVTVRKALRVNLEMPATVTPLVMDDLPQPEDTEPKQIIIRDLSTTGALLVADSPLAEVKRSLAVKVGLRVAEADEELNFVAVVRNIKIEQTSNGSRFLHGVEFQFSDRRESVLMHAFVYEQIVHQEK